MKWIQSLSIASILVLHGCASLKSPVVSDSDCSSIESLSSKVGGNKLQLEFVNTKNEYVEMYWVDYQGNEKRQGSIAPGKSWKTITYEFHPWVVRYKSGDCIRVFNINSVLKVHI